MNNYKSNIYVIYIYTHNTKAIFGISNNKEKYFCLCA